MTICARHDHGFNSEVNRLIMLNGYVYESNVCIWQTTAVYSNFI